MIAYRIAFVISSLGRGGSEKVLAVLAAGLAARGHDVTVVTWGAAAEGEIELASPVRRRSLGLPAPRAGIAQKLRGNLGRVLRLRTALAAVDPDAVIAFGDQTNVTALLATAGRPLPVIVCERAHPLAPTTSGPWRVLRRATYSRAALLVAQSQASGTVFGRTVRGRLRVIGNPLPESAFEGAKTRRHAERAQYVVALGRLVPEKGFDVLLDAFWRLRAAVPDAVLRIYGDGPERDALEVRIAALGLTGRAYLMGMTDDPAAVLRGADVFVLSSRFEGMPNSLLEAMACGTPAVATRCSGAVVEVSGDGAAVSLVAPNDAVQLADAMRTMLNDAPLRRRLAHEAVDRVRRFAESHILDDWEQAIAAVVAGPRPRRDEGVAGNV